MKKFIRIYLSNGSSIVVVESASFNLNTDYLYSNDTSISLERVIIRDNISLIPKPSETDKTKNIRVSLHHIVMIEEAEV